MTLTKEQKNQFFQDGYIVVKELLTTDELETPVQPLRRPCARSRPRLPGRQRLSPTLRERLKPRNRPHRTEADMTDAALRFTRKGK